MSLNNIYDFLFLCAYVCVRCMCLWMCEMYVCESVYVVMCLCMRV